MASLPCLIIRNHKEIIWITIASTTFADLRLQKRRRFYLICIQLKITVICNEDQITNTFSVAETDWVRLSTSNGHRNQYETPIILAIIVRIIELVAKFVVVVTETLVDLMRNIIRIMIRYLANKNEASFANLFNTTTNSTNNPMKSIINIAQGILVALKIEFNDHLGNR